jgi:hypothetical protein
LLEVLTGERGRAVYLAMDPASLVDRAVFDLVEASASRVEPVLLVGEPGGGMDAIAELLHGLSPFAGGPFVTAKSASDIGALVSSAGAGTLYFDDLDALGPGAASELTKLLASQMLTARIVGASSGAVSDAPSHALLLACFPVRIEVPHLGERSEDAPDLMRYFLDVANRRAGSRIGAAETSAEYRLPVRRENATLTLADGTQREGTLFFQVGEKTADLFEPGDSFLPVASDGKVRLYSRAAIACASLPRAHVQDDELHFVVRKVIVRMRSGRTIEGEVRYAPSVERARAVDYLNTSPKGFTVHEAGTVHYLAKDHVEYVEEDA